MLSLPSRISLAFALCSLLLLPRDGLCSLPRPMNHRAVPRVRRRAQLHRRHLIAGVAFRAGPVRTHHWRLRQHSGRRARQLRAEASAR